MDKDWQEWLNTNLNNGCDPGEVVNIMLAHHFAPDDILANINHHHLYPGYPHDPLTLALAAAQQKNTHWQLPAVKLATSQAVRVQDERVQLYLWDDFLSADECDQLVVHINQLLYPSTVTVSNGDDKFRTSRTANLSAGIDPFLGTIDVRIADTLGIDLQYSEPMQAQRYDVGNEFKAHTDFFEPGSEEFELFAKDYGQRTWTFMIYLNETQQGGATRFVNLDTTFYPRKGQAVIWNNLHPDGRVNPDTIHHGMPVEAGEKLIITKWFRDKPSRSVWNS